MAIDRKQPVKGSKGESAKTRPVRRAGQAAAARQSARSARRPDPLCIVLSYPVYTVNVC